MRFNRIALACSMALAGCVGSFSGTDSSSSAERVVTGKIDASSYNLDNPVVVAESSDHRVWITHVLRDGSFRLQLPTNVAYRLTLANSTRSGAFVSVARVNWPLQRGASRWAVLRAGATLDFTTIHPRGSTQFGLQCSGCGGSGGYDSDKGGDCHEDDKAHCDKSSKENDCDSDHKYKDDDCDKDDDADKHDHDCDDDDKKKHDESGDKDDDHDKGGCNCGSSSSDGGAAPSSDDGGSSSSGSCSGSGGSGGNYGSGSGGSGGNYGSGGSGAAIGGMCAMNADCALGLDCVANYCVPTQPTK